MNKSIVIVINGKGGVGKDYCISSLTSKVGEENVENISSIDEIKKIASQYGYSELNKTDKSRKFLSELKRVFTEWNNMPLICTCKKVRNSIKEHKRFIFVHIREIDQIQKFVDLFPLLVDANIEGEYDDITTNDFSIVTLLIKDKKNLPVHFGNRSDDCVGEYNYDYYYTNDKSENVPEGHINNFYDFVMANIVPNR